jgi:hypothetical protein
VDAKVERLPRSDEQARSPLHSDSTLALTLGVDARTVVRLDYLRKQRNVTEYSGDLVSDADVAECVMRAEALYVLALRWLRKNRRDLL